MLWAAGNFFLHVAQGNDVLGSRLQTSDLVGVLLLGHLDLLPRELLSQRVVAEEVVVHLTGGLPAHQQGILGAPEQLQALGSHHCMQNTRGVGRGGNKGEKAQPMSPSTHYILNSGGRYDSGPPTAPSPLPPQPVSPEAKWLGVDAHSISP